MILLADTKLLLNSTTLLPVVAGGFAIWYLLPSPKRRPVIYGALAGVIALATLAVFLVEAFGERVPRTVEAFLFYGFSGLAVLFAALMITARNPARSALAFALVVLSTCGLFLLLAAPFLMAATIVIYAGAIIVTFLFVIMLSQQDGPSSANLRSREPSLAVAAGFVLLATFLVGLQRAYDWQSVDAAIEQATALAQTDQIDPAYMSLRPAGDEGMSGAPLPLTVKAEEFVNKMQAALERVKVGAPRTPGDFHLTDHRLVQDVTNAIESLKRLGFKGDADEIHAACKTIAEGLARLKSLRDGSSTFDDVPRSGYGEVSAIGGGPKQLPAANVSAIGRTLFSDHLLAIELAGTLLLIATVGAIAIAGRRNRGAA